MEETTKLTKEELNERVNKGDMDAVNLVLDISAGKVKLPEKEPEPVVASTPDNITPPIEDIADTRAQEELELVRKRIEFEKQKEQEERERILQEKVELQNKLEAERKAKEEIEHRLRSIEQTRQNPQPNADGTAPESEEEFASDYAKQTRKMVEELRSTVKSDDPKIVELDERLKKWEQKEAEVEQRRKEEATREQQSKVRKVFFSELDEFKKAHPEFQTKKQYEQLSDEFSKFRENLAYVFKAKSKEDVERLMMTFFDETRGSKIREEAKNYGITPPEEHEKFLEVLKLVDFKNGLEYDPVQEKFVQITDSFGNPVTYRSVDEAYRIKNFHKELSETKKQTAREIQTKMGTINAGARHIPSTDTVVASEGAMNREQIDRLINMNPAQWQNNPALAAQVRQAYNAVGMEPPKYRTTRY